MSLSPSVSSRAKSLTPPLKTYQPQMRPQPSLRLPILHCSSRERLAHQIIHAGQQLPQNRTVRLWWYLSLGVLRGLASRFGSGSASACLYTCSYTCAQKFYIQAWKHPSIHASTYACSTWCGCVSVGWDLDTSLHNCRFSCLGFVVCLSLHETPQKLQCKYLAVTLTETPFPKRNPILPIRAPSVNPKPCQ